ncbi:MAG: hypothetical protein LBD17_04250 [Endomicrobium sp.]|jgi:hypothetical protein|nr:hypothetical protein [Endomicrobium sp.]
MEFSFTSNFPEKYLNKDFVWAAVKEKAAQKGVFLQSNSGRWPPSLIKIPISNFPEKYLSKGFIMAALKEKAAAKGVFLQLDDGRHMRFAKLRAKKNRKK